METSAWTLAGGSASVFALAIVLAHTPWAFAFAVVATSVAAWAWRAPLIEAAALGGIGWLCVTGFDVYRYGDLKITGRYDALRMVTLVTTGVLLSIAGPGKRGVRTREPRVWPVRTAAALETETRAGTSCRPMVRSSRNGGPRTRVFSGDPTEETRDG